MTTQVPKPIPRDTERFAKLSPDKLAVMPPGFKFPTAEEFAQHTLDRIAEMYKRGIDGN